MDIKQLACRPKLTQLEVNTPEIVELVGEPITFYMRDHMDLATYFEFYKLQQNQDMNLLMDLMRQVILDADGNKSISPDEILPVEIAIAILYKVNEHMGKSKAKVSVAPDGKVQS
jgi:hypothetical protein